MTARSDRLLARSLKRQREAKPGVFPLKHHKVIIKSSYYYIYIYYIPSSSFILLSIDENPRLNPLGEWVAQVESAAASYAHRDPAASAQAPP